MMWLPIMLSLREAIEVETSVKVVLGGGAQLSGSVDKRIYLEAMTDKKVEQHNLATQKLYFDVAIWVKKVELEATYRALYQLEQSVITALNSWSYDGCKTAISIESREHGEDRGRIYLGGVLHLRIEIMKYKGVI